MEFTFSVNEIFKEPIVEINQNLIPPGFSGDRRTLWDTVTKVSEVVNAMGEASAAAQGLTKPVTTAERLRNAEQQRIYFMVDRDANGGKGAVTGMLKTGQKGLYVFDKEGNHYQVSPPCVLDFYVPESRQRVGLGKRLFEHMLEQEQIQPVQMALDRPSDKFLNFLNKHYTLNQPVKQMNNYVVFDGFFPQRGDINHSGDSEKVSTPSKKNSANGLQHTPSSYGRYGAPRPPCSMGQIIHNQSSTINRGHPAGVRSVPATNYQSSIQNPPSSQSTPNMHYNYPIPNQNVTSSTNYGYNSQGVINPTVTASNTQPGYQYVNNPQPISGLYQNQNFSDQQMQYPSQYQTGQQQTNFQNQYYLQQQNQQPAYFMQNHPVGVNPVSQLHMTNQPFAEHASNQQQQNRQPTQHAYNQAKGDSQMDNPKGPVNQQPTTAYGHNQSSVENVGNQYTPMGNLETAVPNYQRFLNNSSQMQELLHHNSENNQIQSNNWQQTYNAQPLQHVQGLVSDMQNKDVSYATANAGYEPKERHLTKNELFNQPLHSIDHLKDTPTNPGHLPIMGQEDQVRHAQNTLSQFRNYQHQAMPSIVPAKLPNPNIHHSFPNVTADTPNMPQPAATYSIPNTQFNAGQPTQMDATHWSQPNMTHSLPNMPVPTGVSVPQFPPTIPMYQSPYSVGQHMSVHTPLDPNVGLHPPPVQSSGNISVNAFTTNSNTPPQQYQSYLDLNQQNQRTVQQNWPNVKPGEERALTDQTGIHNNQPETVQQPLVNLPQPVQTHQHGHPRLPHTITVNQAPTLVHTKMQQMQNLPQGAGQIMNKPSEIRNQNQYEHIGHAGDFAQPPPRMQTNSSDFNHNIPLANQSSSVAQMQSDEQQREDEGVLKYGYPPQISNDQKSSEEKSTPKLERPRSLSLQQSEEQPEEKIIEGEIKLELVEEIIQDVKTDIENITLDEPVGEKNGETIEDLSKSEEDILSGERKTPSHLTDKGYFDLKFYHNKLW